MRKVIIGILVLLSFAAANAQPRKLLGLSPSGRPGYIYPDTLKNIYFHHPVMALNDSTIGFDTTMLNITKDTNAVMGIHIKNLNAGASAQGQVNFENNAGYQGYFGLSSSNYSGYAPIDGGPFFIGAYLTPINIFTQSAKPIKFFTNGNPVASFDENGLFKVNGLSTSLTAPTPTGSTRYIIVDANGNFSSAASTPSGGISGLVAGKIVIALTDTTVTNDYALDWNAAPKTLTLIGIGNESLLIPHFNTSTANVRIGNMSLQAYSDDIFFQGNNITFDGGQLKYTSAGHKAALIGLQSGDFNIQTAPTGADSGDVATAPVRFSVKNNGNVYVANLAGSVRKVGVLADGTLVPYGSDTTGGTGGGIDHVAPLDSVARTTNPSTILSGHILHIQTADATHAGFMTGGDKAFLDSFKLGLRRDTLNLTQIGTPGVNDLYSTASGMRSAFHKGTGSVVTEADIDSTVLYHLQNDTTFASPAGDYYYKTNSITGRKEWQKGPTSGTYVPTLTNTANISTSVYFTATWTRVGNNVHVTIGGEITPTALNTTTTMTVSLPFTTATTTQAGVGSGTLRENGGGRPFAGVYVSIASGTTATATMWATIATTGSYSLSFDYTL